MAGHAADAHDAAFGGAFWQWPAVQLMLMMAVAGRAADAHDCFGGAFGSGWRCS